MSKLQKASDAFLGMFDVLRKKGPNTGHVPVAGRFLHVMLDVVEKCNLRCTHCAFVYWRDELLDDKVMAPEVVDKLEREVFPHSWRVSLSCFHEPTMAPTTLVNAIKACRRAGVHRVDFVTNGLLLSEEMTRRIMEAGVKRIYFSVDGASDETYDKVRVGGTFKKFHEKLAMVAAVRDQLGLADQVELSFITCMMKSNVHEAPAMVDLAADYKINTLELRYLMRTDAATIPEDELLCHSPELADRWYDVAIARAEERGVFLELLPERFRDIQKRVGQVSPPPPYNNCGFPWNTMVFSPTGDIYPCCLWHGNDRIDEIRTRSFDEVWNGKAFRYLRREMQTGRLTRAGCQECIVHHDIADPGYWKTYHFRS